ncbi:hypothetical protein SAMN05444171_3656 [Bradyrhizobium lablabi]|uniref:Uncharacterized protein n=2 Tax=Bradyrhizobium TaxID=374 RepID=A0ABY0PP03_9BRAD|nr:hypothetical protein SAMN05444163_3508 [Bradyrhizobium ottawaense]SED27434.1 hypothetical protein SAMN05444171_3656 [Bradyrhizobium lablabi]SHL31016.1 hypothetical protein SAMN05444321_2496 [Bradyrhizobium lablabi]
MHHCYARERGIQYAAAFRFDHRCVWNTDSYSAHQKRGHKESGCALYRPYFTLSCATSIIMRTDK